MLKSFFDTYLKGTYWGDLLQNCGGLSLVAYYGLTEQLEVAKDTSLIVTGVMFFFLAFVYMKYPKSFKSIVLAEGKSGQGDIHKLIQEAYVKGLNDAEAKIVRRLVAADVSREENENATESV